MSAVEHKKPGAFLDGESLRAPLDQPGDGEPGDDFDYDTFPFSADEFSYALGARGSTRKKLAAAAGCIMEYIGTVAFIAGNARERRQGREYLEWLMTQREGKLYVDVSDRDDVTIVECPKAHVGYVTGHKGANLRSVEQKTRTFIFTNEPPAGDERDDGDDDVDDVDMDDDGGGEKKKKKSSAARGGREGFETICVFGDDPRDRQRAARIIEDEIAYSERRDRRGGRGRSRSRSRDRYDDRGRDRDRGGRDRGGRDRSYDRGYDDRRRDDRRGGGGGGGGSRHHPYGDRREPRENTRRHEGEGHRRDICYDFLKGRCNRDRCRFSHDDSSGGGGGGRRRSRSRSRSRSRGR